MVAIVQIDARPAYWFLVDLAPCWRGEITPHRGKPADRPGLVRHRYVIRQRDKVVLPTIAGRAAHDVGGAHYPAFMGGNGG